MFFHAALTLALFHNVSWGGVVVKLIVTSAFDGSSFACKASWPGDVSKREKKRKSMASIAFFVLQLLQPEFLNTHQP